MRNGACGRNADLGAEHTVDRDAADFVAADFGEPELRPIGRNSSRCDAGGRNGKLGDRIGRDIQLTDLIATDLGEPKVSIRPQRDREWAGTGRRKWKFVCRRRRRRSPYTIRSEADDVGLSISSDV